MTYNPRAEFLARQAKAAEAETQVSQEDGHVDAGNIEAQSAKGEVDATADASKHTGETVEVASSEGALADTEKAANAAEDHAEVVAGTVPDSQTKEVDATADEAACGGVKEMASTEELNKLPEQTEGSDNVAETEANPSEISTQEPEIATKAEDAPESPVEPYNSSESPEALAKGVVSEIKKVETGVTQVLNEDRAVGELENIATEMRAIIAEKGAMTSAEAMMFSVATQNTLGSVGESIESVDLPSMENFGVADVAGYATEISLEGVMDKITDIANKAAGRISQGFQNIVGLANSLTPLISRLKKRAEAARQATNNSNREAGLKTIDDEDTAITLTVDGSVPNADTVVKTSKYMAAITSELFGDNAWKVADSMATETANSIKEAASATDFSEAVLANGWTMFLLGELAYAYLAKKGEKAVAASTKIKTDKVPSMIKAFPTVAKLNHSVDNPNLEAKRSLPLFGNEAIEVTALKPQITTDAGKVGGVGVRMISLGDYEAKTTEIQTLTSEQQRAVLDNVVAVCDGLIRYYKDFAKRSSLLQKTYASSFKDARNVSEDKVVSRYTARIVQSGATAVIDGVFAGQGKIARSFAVTISALVDLVELSRKATQADDPDAEKAAENRAAVED